MADATPLEFTATTSLADLFAADAAANRQPRNLRRLLRLTAFLLACISLGLAAGFYGSADDPKAVANVIAKPKMVVFAVVGVTIFLVFMTAMQRLLKLVNQAVRRHGYVDHRRHHPAVDRNDPALRMTRSYRFDETGMTTATAFDEVWEGWSRINGLDETRALLILRAGGVSLPLPKAQLPADLQERLRQYVDARSSSKWPF